MLFNPAVSLTPKRATLAKPILELVCGICDLPGLSVMVFTRKRLGVRMVSKPAVIFVSFTLFMFGWWNVLYGLVSSAAGRSWRGVNPWLLLFAVVVFIMGMRRNRGAWNELRAGRLWLTYSRGVSRLKGLAQSMSIPPRLVTSALEPLLCLVAAIVAFTLLSSWGLAAWLLWTGLCLAVAEEIDVYLSRERVLDEMDALLMGEVQSQEIKLLRTAERALPGEDDIPKTKPEEIGLSTDHEADDIQRQLERRRQRRGTDHTAGVIEPALTVPL
jgi:hypothetical protein